MNLNYHSCRTSIPRKRRGKHTHTRLNTSLQGPCTSIFVRRKKTDAFKQKLALWDSVVQKEDTFMFPIFNEYLVSADVNCKELLSIVSQHLKELLTVLTIIFRNMKILDVETFGSTILSSKTSTHASLIPMQQKV